MDNYRKTYHFFCRHVWGQKTSSEKTSWTLFQIDSSFGLSRPVISLVQVEGGPQVILYTFTLT